eukprot:CAMPEP_0174267812 /NCGR_PEP_ID=MMETSP0439-20130205/34991_1 /TAXON_ID=0 /ORGANISM="Stereomyxa ramosa, Strain Chinc5" /LENGTH=347 /DNA_ID=CAMNT_0015355531 /DNA_START=22 /DNA_END=1065 /DNA_ORIENTATION=+
MVRKIEVTVPADHFNVVESYVRDSKFVHNLIIIEAMDNIVLKFNVTDREVDTVFCRLKELKVGVEYGTIDIYVLSSTTPRITTNTQKKKILGRKWLVTDRMAVEEIYESVSVQNALTFNYLCFVLVAALISAVGLAFDSAAVVVASMLVSPLMGPILGISFGTAIGDVKMVWKGFRNETIGSGLIFIVGVLWGFCTSEFRDLWHTEQQLQRADLLDVVGGILVAIPSGVGVAVAVTGGGLIALVGVAISAALLPPITNAGLYGAYYIVGVLKGDETDNEVIDRLIICGYSFLLFVVNFVLIYMFALIVFWIKKIRPFRNKETMSLIDDYSQYKYYTKEDKLACPSTD